MTTYLRVVLDQLVLPTDPWLATASAELARGLVATTPRGCAVEALLPAGAQEWPPGSAERLGELDIRRLAIPAKQFAPLLALGVTVGIGGGMLHSPTLAAPLVRHDPVNDHDQTVVTVWDAEAWHRPGRGRRAVHAWQRAMLKRTVKHADAVVVPTHALAAELDDHTGLGSRIRVIPGAAPHGFAEPADAVGRRRLLGVQEQRDRYVVVGTAGADGSAWGAVVRPLVEALSARQVRAVMLAHDDAEREDIVAALAESAERDAVQVIVTSDIADRAAVLAVAGAFVDPLDTSAYPWAALEAIGVGLPVLAIATPQRSEVLAEAAVLVDASESADLPQRLLSLLDDESALAKLRVLSGDRAKGFSWSDTADRVWLLHADL